MIPDRISNYLDSQRVSYQKYSHSRAYTAQGIAQAQHLSGKKMAKVVMVVVDNSRLIMAVVTASHRVDLDRLGEILNAKWIRLASEDEFQNAFPECELGAMPPFGNLYHLEVWVDEKLRSHRTICFNAGTHADTIEMSYADFERLVHPNTASFGVLVH